MEDEINSLRTHSQTQTETLKNYVTRNRQIRSKLKSQLQGRDRHLEASRMQHAGLIQENVALSEENERMTVAYNLILEEQMESRRMSTLIAQIYNDNPELDNAVAPYEQEFNERGMWHVPISIGHSQLNNNL